MNSVRQVFYDKHLDEIPTSIAIVHQAGRSHYGLGCRLLLMKIIDMAGCGGIQIGPKGTGKTISLEALQRIKHQAFVSFNFYTLASMDQTFQNFLTDNSVTWISYDLAMQSEIVFENTQKVISALLTDRELVGKTGAYETDIKNCNLSWLSAVTYPVFRKILKSNLWEGCFADRILRCYVYDRYNADSNDNPVIVKLPKNNPHTYPDLKNVAIKKDDDYWSIVKLLSGQFEDKRAQNYASDLLRGHARLNRREEVLPIDAEVIRLFSLEIELEEMISFRKTPSDFVNIDIDALALIGQTISRRELSVSYLAKKFKTSDSWILRVVSQYPYIFKIRKKSIERGYFIDSKHDLTVSMTEDFKKSVTYPQMKFENWCIYFAHNDLPETYKRLIKPHKIKKSLKGALSGGKNDKL